MTKKKYNACTDFVQATHSVDLKFLVVDTDGDAVGPVTDSLLVVMEITGELELQVIPVITQ